MLGYEGDLRCGHCLGDTVPAVPTGHASLPHRPLVLACYLSPTARPAECLQPVLPLVLMGMLAVEGETTGMLLLGLGHSFVPTSEHGMPRPYSQRGTRWHHTQAAGPTRCYPRPRCRACNGRCPPRHLGREPGTAVLGVAGCVWCEAAYHGHAADRAACHPAPPRPEPRSPPFPSHGRPCRIANPAQPNPLAAALLKGARRWRW